MKEWHLPGKESEEGKGCISSCRRVILRRCIDLTTSAYASQGIKHARAHEADESKHDYLEIRVVVDPLQSCGTFEDFLPLGARVLAPAFQRLLWKDVCHENDGSVVRKVLSLPRAYL